MRRLNGRGGAGIEGVAAAIVEDSDGGANAARGGGLCWWLGMAWYEVARRSYARAKDMAC